MFINKKMNLTASEKNKITNIKKNNLALHKSLANTLKVLTEELDRNEIEYVLWAGSAIGAELYEGIIPWDDDIDIAIDISDLEKIKNIKFKQEFEIISPESHKNYPFFNLRFIDKNTEILNNSPEYYFNRVWIDIVPTFRNNHKKDKRIIKFYLFILYVISNRDGKFIDALKFPVRIFKKKYILSKILKHSRENNGEWLHENFMLAKRGIKTLNIKENKFVEFEGIKCKVGVENERYIIEEFTDSVFNLPKNLINHKIKIKEKND